MDSLYDESAPDDDILRESYVIQDGRDEPYEAYGPGFGSLVASGEWEQVATAIRSHMDDKQYWPDVYLVNDHGNVSLLNITTGEEVASWV
jgi:hypothetical protein